MNPLSPAMITIIKAAAAQVGFTEGGYTVHLHKGVCGIVHAPKAADRQPGDVSHAHSGGPRAVRREK
jgi:hypothetical protein